MVKDNWLSLLLISFFIVLVAYAFLASCTTLFYRKAAWGRLSHSQLLIKQGKATTEDRLNVFALSLIFGVGKLQLYPIVLALFALLSISGFSIY